MRTEVTTMLTPELTPAADDATDERSIVHIDPDFYVPSHGERGNSYVRAFRILFPKAT